MHLPRRLLVGGVVLVLVWSCAWLPSSAGQRIQLTPVDEATLEPELKRTRDELLVAIKNRDVEGVMRRMHRGFVLDGMSDFPLASFRRSLVSGNAWRQDPSLWAILERVLSGGGAFTTERGIVRGRREFCAPYVFTEVPRVVPRPLISEVSPWVVTVARAPLYGKPDGRSRVIATLSFDVVKVLESPVPGLDGRRWHQVTLPDGQTGYADPAILRNPEDYHVCFAKIDGEWLMVELGLGIR